MTSPNAIDDLVELLEMLEKSAYLTLISELSSFKKQAQKGKLVLFHQPIEGLHIEDFDESEIVFDQSYNVPKSISTLFGDQPVLADNEHYLEMCSDYRLPVIARNNLENGQSKNLWYEQIMPRASRFFFAVTPLDEPICIDFFSEFKEERFVQIGANATIGYGVCSIVPF
jgi:CRISPR-associated protein Cmr4